MIPNNTETATVQSSITGETGQFTVDENSLTHIMSVLTNLYADPELAVVREYLTNAWDSHQDAGQTRPIEVTTPSHFNKSYIIRDFGVGMSVDDLKNVYSKYGASTKRESNTVVGMLGLGSKSALTYTNSFTITAIKNGIQAKAIVSVNEDGVPVFHIVDTRATTEPNGVEINIPVKDRNTFAEKTRNFLQYWPDGVVLVDGAEPEKHGLNEVRPGVFVREATGYGYQRNTPTSYIVMGNVPYMVDPEYVPSALQSLRMGFVAYVPIGTVTIVPSREKLTYNSLTKKVIQEIGDGLVEEIVRKKQEEIDAAPNHAEAWSIINSMASELSNAGHFRNGIKYKGDTFTSQIQINYRRVGWDYNGRSDDYSYSHLSLGNVINQDILFVYGAKFDFSASKVSATMRRKARYYAQTNGHSDSNVYFVKEEVTNPWFDGVPQIDWDTIEAVKVPRNKNGARPTEVPYDFYRYVAGKPAVFDKKGALTSPEIKSVVDYASELASTTKRDVYYISPADMQESRWKRGTTADQLLSHFKDDKIELVVMGANRFDKFLRTHPKARHFKHYVEDYVARKAKAISNVHIIFENLGYGSQRFIESADPRAINDPVLAKFIQDYRNDTDSAELARLQTLTNYVRRASIEVSVPELDSGDNPLENYPLVNEVGSEFLEHLYVYINAQFATN